MNKKQYTVIRDNHQADTMPVFYYFFISRGGVRISPEMFNQLFSQWLLFINVQRMSQIQYYVFKELDKEFNINK